MSNTNEFAARAMQSILANHPDLEPDYVAEKAFDMAEAMQAEYIKRYALRHGRSEAKKQALLEYRGGVT